MRIFLQCFLHGLAHICGTGNHTNSCGFHRCHFCFCGPRTAQYGQVGNAVPPLLAYQISEVVWNVLKRNGKL
jgi:site-specific DNA-cytosine methylase